VGIVLGVASGAETESTAAAAAVGAIEKLLRDVDQRRTMRDFGLGDDAAIDQLVTDSLDDAAIRNSPRFPTAPEARAILESVAG
ncbi:MAG: iron-containing alcohol dehydrogenase, partial [Chloroflexota bacterium]